MVTNTNSYKIQVSNDEVGADPSGFENDFTFTDKGFEVVADREVYVSLRIKAIIMPEHLLVRELTGSVKIFWLAEWRDRGKTIFPFSLSWPPKIILWLSLLLTLNLWH